MDRWTMEELERTDDIDFAIAILNERRAKLTPYSPLGTKLTETVHALATIKEERDRYIEKVAEATARAQITMEEAVSFDAPEEGPCDPCQPTFPECDGCDYAEAGPQKPEEPDLSALTRDEYRAYRAEESRRAIMELLAKVERPDGDRLSEILTDAAGKIEALQEDLSAETEENDEGNEGAQDAEHED